MNTHTPEPWAVHSDGEANKFTISGPNGNWLMSVLHNGEAMPEKIAMNALRIIACVNALAGLDDTQIEQISEWCKSPTATPMFDLVAKNRILEAKCKDQRLLLLQFISAFEGEQDSRRDLDLPELEEFEWVKKAKEITKGGTNG
jgi:hypothetical protein